MAKISIVQNILAVNDDVAREIRQMLQPRGLRTINLMSSAGAGKTTLLEQTIKHLNGRLRLGVIEGDVETAADAERIDAAGGESVQIITQGTCHLEAHMVRAALAQIDLEAIDMLFVENVGNLVCPAGWDLGEDLKAVVVSTTEGDDKPAKYPHMFAASQVMLINKTDLLPYVDYDLSAVKRFALAVNPRLRIFELSCRTGEGLAAWCDWLLAFTHAKTEISQELEVDG
ncbi:MAG: hydrogenase nickel incorporation protein HypB [Chloroflexota bacterium]|nr:hydrogenase nickel incorporation protein HypB [Chloroflexota bacterium]